ncbi:phage tail spike protein [Heyndrickxia ginsengihumi]|uniref:phage tail spike protein n=1 Tax=Heyndrickxia ginsengihumi TaxID=363870 RepID=UPI00068E1342|nr:phage tail spike protein [Heyndrickxia ginsengihumi]
MYPILYSADETDFTHNGLGILRDSISATATEEANGQFELHIEYDSDGIFADVIDYEMIIKAKANDKQDLQLFRIYAINKSLENDNLVIDAQHITYDLAGNFVESLELDEATAAEAMETIQNNLAYPTRFTISSDNTVTKSSTKLYRTNPLQMIGGIDGSIIDNWGGEIERDNFRLILHAKRGSDDGVLVSYEKNLTGLEAKFDISNVVTRIFPFKALEDGTVLTIPGKYIDSPNINAYNFIRILPVDYSQDEDVIDQDSLYAKSSTYFSSGGHDQPTVTMEVTFESLWKTEEYKDVAALELVGMGDTITVHHKKMNVDATTKVVKIEYDVISEKNAKVTAGSLQTSLSNTVNNVTDGVQNTIDQAISTANTAIQAANGKNTIYYGPDEPTDAQKGDLWFKVVNGEYTRTYRFDGVQWQLVMDMDVTLVQQDVANALSQANNAVSTANQATQNAQNAIDKAQDGFDKAQAALTAANNATDTANTAKQVASDAATQAGTAKANAQTAMSNAQDAINKANAANDNANTREKSIIKSNTAPSNPATDQLWIDTSKTPQIMRRWNGSTWVDLSPTQANQIGAVSSTTYTTDITNINNTLSQKASITTVNTLSGRVDEAETAITQNANDIALKADKNVVDTLKNIVDNHSTLISQNADAIALKASQSTVDALTGRVSTAEATLTTQANQIAARITKTDADAKYATQTALTATANSLTSNISAVQTNLDNLQIGGRNLAPFDKWQAWGGAPISKGSNTITLTSDGTNYYGIYHYEDSKYEPSTDYVLTFKASLISGSISRMGGHSGIFADSSSITKVYVDGNLVSGALWSSGVPISPSVGVTHTFEVHLRTKGDYSGETKGMFIQPNRGNFGSTYSVKFWDLQIEKGNKATDWTPAPEDMATVIQFNTLSQTLDSTVSRIGNAEGNISALQQTSSSFATRINNAENDITSLIQTAQGLQTQVTNNKNDITTVTQTASTLQTRMTNAEGSINTLTSTASSLTSQIGTLQTNLENLSIGGRNLLYNSTFNFGLDGWENTASNYSVLSPESDKPKSNILRITSASNTSQESSKPFPIVANQSYVISFDVRIDTNANTNNLLFTVRAFDSADISNSQANSVWYQNLLSYQNITVTNTWKRFTFTITPTAGKYLRVIPYNAYTGSKADFREIKIEVGRGKATDWSPAPEDLATQSQITQLADDINLRVKENDVINQINVSTESILIAGNKVHITGQTTIDNAVITSAMIQSIDAGKITAGTLDASKVSVVNLNASNIKSGTLNAITINGGTGSFTGKVQTIYTSGGNTLGTEMFSGGMYAASSYGNTVEYGADSIQLKSYPSSISVDQSSIYNSVSNNRGKETLTTDISPASITLNALTTAGQYLTGKYLDIEVTTSKADISSNVDLYVESLSGDLYLDSSAFGTIYIGGNTINLLGKVNFTWDAFNSIVDVSKGLSLNGHLKVGNGPMTVYGWSDHGRIEGATAISMANADSSTYVNFYVGVNGEMRVTSSYDNSTYFPARASEWRTGSLEEYKQDIELMPESGLEIVNSADIYRYRLKSEVQQGIDDWKYGLVIGAGRNTPEQFMSPDHEAINQYDTLSIALKAIKEQYVLYQDHQNQISILLEQNQNLILKVAELESRLAKLEVA